jgi:hypothetical protein
MQTVQSGLPGAGLGDQASSAQGKLGSSATQRESDAMSTTPPAVRILPMDSQLEFDGRSIEEVQQTFFLKELLGPERPPGKYWYRESGLNADSGTTVLFQYDGRLIASATLIEVERVETPEKGTYRGALYFDVNSIKVFDPIGPEAVTGIWPEFKGLSRVKWTLDPKRFAEFERELAGIERPKL